MFSITTFGEDNEEILEDEEEVIEEIIDTEEEIIEPLIIEEEEEIIEEPIEKEEEKQIIEEEEIVEEDTEELEVIEEEEIPLAAPEEEEIEVERPPISVYIYSDKRSVMSEGEIVNIYSEIVNGEYYDIAIYEWYYTPDDINWYVIPGANESVYSFAATAESLSYGYRLTVYYR